MNNIDVYQAMWGMEMLPSKEAEWTLEEKLTQIEEVGFDGVLNFIDDFNDESLEASYKASQLINGGPLKLGLSCNGFGLEDMKEKIDYAAEVKGEFLNIMVMDYFTIGEEAIKLLRDTLVYGQSKGVKVFIETHRRTLTQDLIRTVDYVEAIDEMLLTIDISHYIVSGELGEPSEKIEEAFDKLLRRTGSMHLRISNGEQVQVPLNRIAPDQLENYKRWWKAAKAYGEKYLAPNERLPIVVELGPEDYHQKILVDGQWIYDGDRFVEALKMKDFIKNL